MLLMYKRLSFIVLIISIFFIGSIPLESKEILSPKTEKAIAKFRRLDQDIEFGASIPEKLLRCSYLQDAWLAYLHEAEDQKEFLLGMAEIDHLVNHFRDNLNYAATVVNFYNPGKARTLFPQRIQIGEHRGFLNTFKKGRDLTDEEREEYYREEWSKFEKELTCLPFDLDASSLHTLQSGRIYNFALLPDGTIRVALEKPGRSEYLMNEEAVIGDFAYPNHTILAGGPNQALLSAGALTLYRYDDKEVIFISNKSGHFVPSYNSLKTLKEQLKEIGVDPHTVIMVPTVDLSEAVLTIYNTVQIPVSIVQEDLNKLFALAHQRWIKSLDQLDVQILTRLAQEDSTALSRKAIGDLNLFREEATYMRSAYKLFTATHEAPSLFHEFVKRFGMLKDAIKHDMPDHVFAEAQWLVEFIEENGDVLIDSSTPIAHEADFYEFIIDEIIVIKSLLERNELSIDEFHLIKKSARELGSLFQNLSEESIKSGHKYSIYQAAASKFFQINQLMANIHDVQVGKIMHGEITEEEIILQVPQNIKNQLNRLLSQLGVAPPTMDIAIVENTVFRLIYESKEEWYHYHHLISCHPDEFIDGVHLPYAPHPFLLLSKLAYDNFEGLDDDDLEAIELLKITLRKAEIAKNALIFLDESHAVPSDMILYITSLRKILNAIEKNTPESVANEAAAMLEFMRDQGTPTLALEHYRCTEQKSFNETVKQQVGILKWLQAPSISQNHADMALESTQALADLMNLYLLIGQKHHTLPTVAYEESLHDCEILIEELKHQMKYAEINGQIATTVKLNCKASRLLKKFKVDE